MTDTNAGPVLPAVRGPDATDGYTNFYFHSSIEAYGLQCWNACNDHVAGPLRERVAELEREDEISEHVIERTTRLLAECVVILRGPEPPLTGWSYHDIPQLVQALKDDRDRLRAESVIEWEPGRSYTAAELLRRAIRGLRVRKDSDLWPAVRNMCGVGSGVAHFLCRWAGRDPDTGATIEGTK